MRIAFISALHNNLPLSQAMLASLRATLPPGLDHEIHLIDDASSDGTPAWLHSLPAEPHLHLHLLDRGIGFGAANNLAARAATSADVLVLLNNDLVLLPGWLEPLLAPFTATPPPAVSAALRSGGTLGFVGNVQRLAADRAVDHRGVRLDRLRRPYHDRRPHLALRAYTPAAAVTAACCAIRRDVFLAAGGFDEAYRNGFEDIDLCLRLACDRHRHLVAQRSVVLHHVSAAPGRFTRESDNLRLYFARWGWPPPGPPFRLRGLDYVSRHAARPWRYNGPKLLLALAWLVTGRACGSLEQRLGVTVRLPP